MPKQVKYVGVKKRWTDTVNEKHLARIIEEMQAQGWVYECLENHGGILNPKWVARFSKEYERTDE